jgi:hypothetical protein
MFVRLEIMVIESESTSSASPFYTLLKVTSIKEALNLIYFFLRLSPFLWGGQAKQPLLELQVRAALIHNADAYTLVPIPTS